MIFLSISFLDKPPWFSRACISIKVKLLTIDPTTMCSREQIIGTQSILHHIDMNRQPIIVVNNVYFITSKRKVLGCYHNNYGGIQHNFLCVKPQFISLNFSNAFWGCPPHSKNQRAFCESQTPTSTYHVAWCGKRWKIVQASCIFPHHLINNQLQH